MTQKAIAYPLFLALLLALSGLATAYENELAVVVSEEIDAQAESDGAYTWNYNLTGGMLSLQVLNEQSSLGTGNNDTRLFDIFVPFGDSNAVLDLASCDIITNDSLLDANSCAVQVCELVDGAPPTASNCLCGDMATAASLDLSRAAITSYNPNLNGTGETLTYVLHINELQGDSYILMSCELTGAGFIQQGVFPVSFGETFSPRKIVNNACTGVTVNLTVRNNFDDSPCEDLGMTVKKVLSTGGGWSDINATSSDGGSIEGDKNVTWSFNLTAGGTTTLNFTVLACPNMTGNTSKLEMGRAYVDFQLINTTCATSTFTNVTIGHVSAVGPAEVNVSKEHFINSDPPNWAENATFYDSTVDLNYTIYRFRLWAENGTDPTTVDPNDPALAGSEHNCTGLPDGIAAGGTYTCDGETFTSDDIPTVFGQPIFELVEGGVSGWEDYVQFENSKNASLPLGSDYFLIENMWVINGYLVKATKTVTPASEPGCYNVTIEVKNLGDTCTPYLYVYDIVPDEFYNMSANGINGNTSPWNIMVSTDGTNGTIATPGNAQPLLSYGIYNLTNAWLLAYATPPVIAEDWFLGNFADTFNDSQYTGKTTLSGTTYKGVGYRWELFPMSAAGASGIGDECPSSSGMYENLNISAENTVLITYAICADDENITYYPSELFIVGIDPVQAEGAAAPPASVGIGAGEKSGEPLLLAFLALLAIIAGALFVTRRRYKP